MKKLWDLRNVFGYLELEGQGHGIIMGVTRLLLLGQFYSIQTNFLYFFAHDCTCVHLKLYVILSLFYRPLLCEMLDTLLDLTKLELCAFIDRQHKYKKNLLQSYSPSWNDYNHFLNFMCDIEIVYLARNTPFILTETLYQWIFVFLIPLHLYSSFQWNTPFILTETLYQWIIFVCRIPCICLLWVITKISTDPNKVNFLYATF